MLLVTEWRAHHAPGGMIPVRMRILAFIQGQMLDQRLTIDAHAFLARTADGFMSLLAGRCAPHRAERRPYLQS